jgi:arabinogalactan oligomer / maltooligosaccharide transport system substrate-binding protein
MEAIITAAQAWNATVVDDGSNQTNAEKGRYYLNTSSHWADSYFMQGFYSAFGFTPFGPTLDDPSEVGFENAVNALTWFNSALKPITTGSGAHNSVTGSANFEAGLVPYIIAGPWNHEGYENAGVNYGVAQMPTINGEPMQTFAGAMMAAVYKYSENKEAAIKFVEFLNSDIAMQLQYEFKTKLPALKTDLLSNIEGVADDEKLMAMAVQLQTSVPMPTIPQVTYYWGPGETMIQAVWNNGIAPATAAATAEQSYQVLAGLSAN